MLQRKDRRPRPAEPPGRADGTGFFYAVTFPQSILSVVRNYKLGYVSNVS